MSDIMRQEIFCRVRILNTLLILQCGVTIEFYSHPYEVFFTRYYLPRDLLVLFRFCYSKFFFVIHRFTDEARTVDGNPYSPSSLTCLIAGLQRYGRDVLKIHEFRLFDKGNALFSTLRDSLDRRRKFLLANGEGQEHQWSQWESYMCDAVISRKSYLNFYLES